jgi:hypothetical protein
MMAFLFAFLALLAAGPTAQAENAEPILLIEEAERNYADGLTRLADDPAAGRELFRTSADRLERLRRDFGTSAEIEYNLGNARVQAGDLGRGIAAYLRAERLAPADPRIAANLAHARSLVTKPITGDAVRPAWSAVGSWWTPVDVGTRFVVFAVAWTVAWIAFAGLFLARGRATTWGRPVRNLAITLAAVAIAAGGTVALDLAERSLRPLGVTVSDGIEVRKGNGEGFAPQIAERLAPGIEFLILERRPGWVRMRLPDATEGWICDEQMDEA